MGSRSFSIRRDLVPPQFFLHSSTISIALIAGLLETGKMRLRIILAALVLSFPTPGFASAKAGSSADLHAFYGEVQAIDLAAKTITIKLGNSFVFHITDKTKISGRDGPVSLDKIKPGE